MVVDCDGLDSIVARQVGKPRLNLIPVDKVLPDSPIASQRAPSQTNLATVPEEDWQAASKRFSILKPF